MTLAGLEVALGGSVSVSELEGLDLTVTAVDYKLHLDYTNFMKTKFFNLSSLYCSDFINFVTLV